MWPELPYPVNGNVQRCLPLLILQELSLSTMIFPTPLPVLRPDALHTVSFLHTSSEGGDGRGCATPPSALTSRPRELGAWAQGVRPGGEQCWQPAPLRLAHRREKLRQFVALLQESYGLQPRERHEHQKYLWNESPAAWWDWGRTCCEYTIPQLWDILG